MHAHGFDCAEHSPRLHFSSPAPRCGKTTLLNTVKAMVPKPVSTENISQSALFRIVEMAQPTLLIDEADILLKDNDDLRAMLNAGHSRGGTVIRTVGDDFEPRGFSVWGPVVIAGIGQIPITIEDRSISISLRRRKRDEEITRLRSNRTDHLKTLARRAARWIADHTVSLNNADPKLPDELGDREHDNWRPLIAIADLISEDLGTRARAAAIAISKDETKDDDTAAILCLSDVADVFATQNKTKLASETIVIKLVAKEDRPWASWRKGKPMTQNSLARLLKPFGIRPKTLRISEQTETFRGYEVEPIKEAKARYCEAPAVPPPAEESAPAPRSPAAEEPVSQAAPPRRPPPPKEPF